MHGGARPLSAKLVGEECDLERHLLFHGQLVKGFEHWYGDMAVLPKPLHNSRRRVLDSLHAA